MQYQDKVKVSYPSKIKMEKLFRDSSVLVEPMFHITLETFYAVNMVPAFWLTFFFIHEYSKETQALYDTVSTLE